MISPRTMQSNVTVSKETQLLFSKDVYLLPRQACNEAAQVLGRRYSFGFGTFREKHCSFAPVKSTAHKTSEQDHAITTSF